MTIEAHEAEAQAEGKAAVSYPTDEEITKMSAKDLKVLMKELVQAKKEADQKAEQSTAILRFANSFQGIKSGSVELRDPEIVAGLKLAQILSPSSVSSGRFTLVRAIRTLAAYAIQEGAQTLEGCVFVGYDADPDEEKRASVSAIVDDITEVYRNVPILRKRWTQ